MEPICLCFAPLKSCPILSCLTFIYPKPFTRFSSIYTHTHTHLCNLWHWGLLSLLQTLLKHWWSNCQPCDQRTTCFTSWATAVPCMHLYFLNNAPGNNLHHVFIFSFSIRKICFGGQSYILTLGISGDQRPSCLCLVDNQSIQTWAVLDLLVQPGICAICDSGVNIDW